MKMDTPRQLVQLLERLAQAVVRVDAQPQHFGTDVPLHRAEIHGIEAIGELDGPSLGALADHLAVTKGAASQLARKLTDKGLVGRTEAPHDRRGIRLHLTEAGRVAFEHHARFHALMTQQAKGLIDDRKRRRKEPASNVIEELLAMVEGFEHRVEATL